MIIQLITRLYFLSLMQLLLATTTFAALSNNNCHRTESMTIIDHGAELAIETHNIKTLGLHILDVIEKTTRLHQLQNGKIETSMYNCLTYGKPFKMIDTDFNLNSLSYQVRDLYLIVSKSDPDKYFCIQSPGRFRNKTSCEEILQLAKTTFSSPDLQIPSPADSNDNFNPLHVNTRQMATYVFSLQNGKAKWTQDQLKVTCKDKTYKKMLMAQNNIHRLGKDILSRIFQFLRPIITQDFGKTQVLITNNQTYFQTYQNIKTHSHQLFYSLGPEKNIFPRINL